MLSRHLVMRIRVGGSLQDQVVYQVGDSIKKFPHFKRDDKGLFGFTRGSLPMDRWDQLNNLFNQTGAKFTFGFNALIGKHKSNDSILWVGEWNSRNAYDLMKYTISKGHKIDSYELGNELCASGVSARLDAVQYGKDLITLKKLVDELYPDPETRPAVLGPAGFYDEKWFNTFFQVTGPNVAQAITHHIYNLGPGSRSIFLGPNSTDIQDLSISIKENAPWAGPWVGESGGAYNSGGKDVSHTFADGFWYLDQLGMTATFTTRFSADKPLLVEIMASLIPHHSYQILIIMAWDCSILINMSNQTTFSVSVLNDNAPYPRNYKLKSYSYGGSEKREEYHLTPEDGNIQSDVVLLNGTPLKLTSSLEIPEMKPKYVDPSTPITVAPDSFVYVTIKDFKAPACA
ncbi:hypothetical protein GH714_030111 [Hevea brasiliensis]|uniref:Uncharacterized protein n=1 Tax=Hevea brasiliensis TaxID=3981 RepID=A0A6A6L3J9_HEVBR|nr:hypothetical protein GH714_030111 [Hevea brasiliensis]